MEASRLKNRLKVYGKVKFTNDLNEKAYKDEYIKSVWAEITPQNGSMQNGQVNTSSVNISYKIVVRSKAIPELSNNMHFMYKGQRYDIKYFNPNFKKRDSVEIFCDLVVE